MGIFYPFIEDTEVELIGVEAAGCGIASGKHAASLTAGRFGVLHGAAEYVLQDDDGQVREAHSIAAGLDYPGVGPEHCWLKDSGRARYEAVTDEEALEAFCALARLEGIIPALESAHAVAQVLKMKEELQPDDIVVINLSGRGDKDVNEVEMILESGAGRQGCQRSGNDPRIPEGDTVKRIASAFETAAAQGRGVLVIYVCGGDPNLDVTEEIVIAAAEGGADIVEVGIPYSDPIADGAASQRALRAGTKVAGVLETVARIRKRSEVPVVIMTCYNPVLQFGEERFASQAAQAGVDAVLVSDLPPEESDGWVEHCKRHDLGTVFLVAPTTLPERIPQATRRRVAPGSGAPGGQDPTAYRQAGGNRLRHQQPRAGAGGVPVGGRCRGR